MPLCSPVDNFQKSGEEANLDVVGLAFALSAILTTFRCLRLSRPDGRLDAGSDSWQGIEADETTLGLTYGTYDASCCEWRETRIGKL